MTNIITTRMGTDSKGHLRGIVIGGQTRNKNIHSIKDVSPTTEKHKKILEVKK